MTEQRSSKYLVCVDDTDVSRTALRFACIKAKMRHIEIDMLHVIAPIEMQAIPAVADKMHEEQRTEAEAMLDELAREANEASGITPNKIVRYGNPADEIIAQLYDDYYTNMLVLGVTPNSNSGRKVISSLVNQFCDKTHLPIMLVPGSMSEAEMHEYA